MQKLGSQKGSASPQEKLVECIDRALAPLGKTFSAILYWQVKMHSGLDKNQIPLHPVLFGSELQRFLGRGHVLVEYMIVKEIVSAFFIDSPCQNLQQAFKIALSS